MGTHPIFESDFDCLTDCNLSMRTNEQKKEEFKKFFQEILCLDKKQNFSSEIKQNKWLIFGGVLAATSLGCASAFVPGMLPLFSGSISMASIEALAYVLLGSFESIVASKVGVGLQEISDCKEKESANKQLIEFEGQLKSKMNLNKSETLKVIQEFARKNELDLTDKKLKVLESRLSQMMNEIEYDKNFPETEAQKKHREENFPAYYFQFVGERGVGKSSLINAILENFGNKERAFVDSVEATLETGHYDNARIETCNSRPWH